MAAMRSLATGLAVLLVSLFAEGEQIGRAHV